MSDTMSNRINQLGQVYQNLIVGVLMGVFGGYVIKFFFQRFGASTLVWSIFILFGAGLGYLSGKEREKYDRLQEEKGLLEEDFEKAKGRLRNLEGRYRLLVETISDAIYLTTEKGQFLLFNEAVTLLSGYSRNELKKMTLDQVQTDNEFTESHRRAWLDNGICRFEEQWRNKDGQVLYLDVSAKWIKLDKTQCILHVARDIKHRADSREGERVLELAEFSRNRLHEVAAENQQLVRKFISPMNATMDAVNKDLKKLPAEDAKFSPFFMEWEKMRKALQYLVARNSRNLEEERGNWTLAEVLRQELFHIAFLTGSDDILKNASFSKDIPPLIASGRDLSLAFEILLRAAYESLPRAAKQDLSVRTSLDGGKALTEIRAPGAIHFRYFLTKAVNPAATKEQAELTDIGEKTLRALAQAFGGETELEITDAGVTARVKIPVA
jgi:PAS domain S-box-containing protein